MNENMCSFIMSHIQGEFFLLGSTAASGIDDAEDPEMHFKDEYNDAATNAYQKAP